MALPLKKSVELVGLRLKKFRVPENLIARVVMVNDGSGSMANLYGLPERSFGRDHVSVMQQTIDRCLAVAVRFDDNQSLEQFIFDSSSRRLPDATPESFGSYVKKNLVPNFQGGSTVYSSALQDVLDTYDNPPSDDDEKPGLWGRIFGSKKAAPQVKAPADTTLPMFVMFITDGENAYNDRARTESIIQQLASRNVYVMFLGIGTEQFSTLKELDAKYDNVGFASLADLASVDEEKLYEILLNEEFCTWIKKFAPAAA